MDIKAVWTNAVAQLREHGVGRTIQSLGRRAHVHFQEWRFGIHTDAVVELSELGITNQDFKYYSATGYSEIASIVRALDIDPRPHVFLDYGAGMGRAVILAATYPFRRVVGVEVSPQLVEIAQWNIARSRRRLKCRSVEVIVGDATKYAVPDDVTIAYFNNPFFGRVLDAALAHLRASLSRAPRPLFVVCNLPAESHFAAQIGREEWLTLEKRFVLESGRSCLIYRAS